MVRECQKVLTDISTST